MLTLDQISLRFPDGDSTITALDEVSLTAHPGTVTAITGPSGSGKSSLLAVAATLIRPTSGRVAIDGIDVTGLSRDEATALRRERIGIVFQQSNLLPALTAVEQLCVTNELGGRGRRSTRRETAARAVELLNAVGLGEHLEKRPHQLSGGQRQRVNIARALMNNPSVLLVDEPTSALDQARGEQIIQLILELTDRLNTATLLVTHDLVHLPHLHREVNLVDGQIKTRQLV
ncbi:ABC transporter ATP-binding protein [Gulosibacter chungangensis]|uniref:ABC transporter ATP-binding protein n=1 Tax=Gulosibacter chungangensis TaxID=979746 RepID=A0A7J5BF51_9MICO|nr:ABC transporter ATP-binding protein [Gulosibacter chungangensis]KAB1644891.1 ABC transporter ATP-binding protein [Gulosibacter chungangensis]